MNIERIFKSADFFQPTEGEPIRSVVTETQHAVIVAWYVKPGQEIAPHLHPNGQDTWTILSGQGEYYLDKAGNKQDIKAGDVVVAPLGNVHGVINKGDEPLCKTYVNLIDYCLLPASTKGDPTLRGLRLRAVDRRTLRLTKVNSPSGRKRQRLLLVHRLTL